MNSHHITPRRRTGNVGEIKSAFVDLRGVAVSKHIEKERRAFNATAGR